MAIVKPSEMDFSDKNIIMIISGLPGTGKTTLALSAPDVVLVDCDEGMARVNSKHRKDSVFVGTHEVLLEDIKQLKGVYKTVVIDTGGSLIELLKDWAIRNEPSASKKNGGFSQQGFGFVKAEFSRLSAELRKDFNVVYIFHETKEKTTEGEVFYELVCEGSARTLVWQPADLGAHLHMINGKRYLGFTPTANYNAKSAYGVKGLVEVPELKEGDINDFLTKLFERVKKALSEEAAENAKANEEYEQALATGQAILNELGKPEDALKCLNSIRNISHALTSLKELEAMFKKKAADEGWVYDGKVKAYVAKE